jgi:ElaB/YqjD/DUF883 family membrane-anchored ribosome-binding protein
MNPTAPAGGFQQGGWYEGRQYWDGTFSEPGQINKLSNQQGAGQQVSKEVIAQTNPNNVSYIDNQISANNIQPPVSVPTSSGATGQFVGSLNNDVEVARKNTEQLLTKQKEENAAKLSDLRAKEQATITSMGELTTPFRADLEATQREALHINENFEANQKLTSELDALLTEGNDLIKQQKDVTGLAAIRNPRIQKSMDDVAARAGVIQAVISARNGQISTAENMIDRSINAITADRQDRLTYYSTILNLNSRDILSLDTSQKNIAQEEINIAKSFLDSAQKNADYFKQLLINPATASLMGEAGVSLTDTPEQVSAKLATASYKKEVSDLSNKMTIAGNTPVYDPSTVPAGQLTSVTDSRGKTYYFQKEAKVSTTNSSDDYLKKLIGGSSSSTTGGKTKSTSTSSASSGLKPPQFSPVKGVGAIYQDPQTGVFWKYTNSGWQLL